MLLFLAFTSQILAAAYDKSGVMFSDDTFQTLVLAPQDLSQYTVPAATTVITGGTEANSAFANCRSNIRKLYFEEGSQLKTIQKYAFYKCAFDDTINMSMCVNLTVFSEASFQSCDNLKHIIFPPFVNEFKSGSFSRCKSLLELFFPKSIQSIGGWQSSTFPAAFVTCPSLKRVTFEKGAKISIFNDDLFANGNLSTFEIPANVTKFRGSALMNNKIHNISVESGNTAFCTDGLILTNLQKNIIYYCCPLVSNVDVIPDTITVIEDSAFRYCLLETITIPESVISLGFYGFASSKIKFIFIPKNVSRIADCAFRYCNNLVKIDIQANVASLGSDLFANCTNLSEIILPSTVKILSTYVFRYCSSLKHVKFLGPITSIGNGCFAGTQKSIFVEFTKESSYSIINGLLFNSEKEKIVSCLNGTMKSTVIPSTVTKIEEMAFFESDLISVDFTQATQLKSMGASVFQGSHLESVAFPPNITSISSSAFDSCIYLRTVDFSQSQNVSQIGSKAFKNTSIKSIILPQSVLYLLESAFEIETLEMIKIGTNVKTIGSRCFANSKISSFIVPTSCTSFGENVFTGSSLERIIFDWPSSLTSISSYSFNNCSKLSSVDLYNNQFLSIERSAFEGCISLTKFSLTSSIITIQINAFKGCFLLESVDIPDDSKLKTIEGLAFEGCENLKNFKVNETNLYFRSSDSVLYDKNVTEIIIYLPASNRTKFVLPETVINIRAYAFQNARNLQEVDIRKCKINSIGHKAFSGCLNLMHVYLPSSLKSVDSMAFESCPLLGCGSISYNGPIKFEILFAGTMIKEEALVPCPTIEFSNIFNQDENIISIFFSSMIFFMPLNQKFYVDPMLLL